MWLKCVRLFWLSVLAGTGCLGNSSSNTFRPRACLYHDQPGVEQLAYSLDGKVLASAGGTTIVLWDTSDKSVVGVLAGHRQIVDCVAFSRDGSLLMSGDYDGIVKVWDVAHSTEVLTFRAGTAAVESICVSFDGKSFVTACHDNTLTAWDMYTYTKRKTLSAEGVLTSLASSPDGKLLAWTYHKDGDGQLSILDWSLFHEKKRIARPAVPERVEFAPDSMTLAIADSGGNIGLFDVARMDDLPVRLSGEGHLYALAFSLDGRQLVTAGIGKDQRSALGVWNVDSQRKVGSLDSTDTCITTIAFNPAGDVLATGALGGKVKLWDSQKLLSSNK